MHASPCTLTRNHVVIHICMQDRVPLKWMAPEAIRMQRYSFASDIWGYGVLLWEILALGAPPYGESSALEVAMAVSAGERLPRPLACPLRVYTNVLLRVWTHDPRSRPEAQEVLGELQSVLESPGEWADQTVAYAPHTEGGADGVIYLSPADDAAKKLYTIDALGPHGQPAPEEHPSELEDIALDYRLLPAPFRDQPLLSSSRV